MINFYCYIQDKKIIASDLPVDKIRSKFGHRYEILTTIKDKDAIDVTKSRILRSYPQFIIEEVWQKVKQPVSEETKRKISESKIGKPRDPETRAKISAGLKGRSNFQGKRHNDETKKAMAEKKLGNQHVKDYIWVHDPRGDKEKRVKTRMEIPVGFSEGRDYYSTEPGFYYFLKNRTKD